MGLFGSVRDFFADISPTWLVMMFAGPYVAGETEDAALETARKLWEERKIWSTVDMLGESVKDPDICRAWADMYVSLQKKIAGIPSANVSLKPTALGLLISPDECTRNVEKVVKASKEMGRFVRIDMEDKTTTDYTLDLYRRLRDSGYDNVGTVVQAYLKRTYDDVARLIEEGYKPNLRICKGIYKADRDFRTMAEINDNFVRIAKLMAENGCYPALATHDINLIDRLKADVVDAFSLKPDDFEWQMLLGVPVEKKQKELLEIGHHCRIYIPFGKRQDAAAYCRRRFKENPKLFFFILRNIFSKR